MKFYFCKPHEVSDMTNNNFTCQPSTTDYKFLINMLFRHSVPNLIEAIAVVLQVKICIYLSVM